MSARGNSEDWGQRPSRARQPLGPAGIEQKRNRGLQRTLGARHGEPRDAAGRLEPREAHSRDGARGSRSGLRKTGEGGRSWSVAVLVLVAVAVVVIVGGILATTGYAGSGGTVSISILDFPQNTADTTTTQ